MTEKINLELKEKQLIVYEEMLKNKSSQAEILEKAGISRATFYRWNKNYKCCGITELKELFRRPHRTREKSALTNETMEEIKQARLEHPMYGKAKLRAVLRKGRNNAVGKQHRQGIKAFYMRRKTVEPGKRHQMPERTKTNKEIHLRKRKEDSERAQIPDAAGPYNNRHSGRQGVQCVRGIRQGKPDMPVQGLFCRNQRQCGKIHGICAERMALRG